MGSSSNEVRQFLLARQHRDPSGNIDWGERRRQWLEALDRLFHEVQADLLAESIAEGLVDVCQTTKTIDEEFLGKYEAPELSLVTNGETVRLSPRGRNVIGANGRVDLIGELDTVTLILDADGEWSVVLSRVPRNVAPLDAKSFTDALRRVMR